MLAGRHRGGPGPEDAVAGETGEGGAEERVVDAREIRREVSAEISLVKPGEGFVDGGRTLGRPVEWVTGIEPGDDPGTGAVVA